MRGFTLVISDSPQVYTVETVIRNTEKIRKRSYHEFKHYSFKNIWLRCDGSQMNICHAVGYGVKKMSQIFYFLMIRDRRKLMTLLELHGEFVVGFFVPNCALFNRKILGK